MYNKGSTFNKDNTDIKTIKIKEKAVSPYNNNLNIYTYIQEKNQSSIETNS